jgi:hypothetical protein
MSDPEEDEMRVWFVSLNNDDRIRLLSRLLVEISIAAREAYSTADADAGHATKLLHSCNELVHQVSRQLDHYLRNQPETKRYPDDVFVPILFDVARMSGEKHLGSFVIRRARQSLEEVWRFEATGKPIPGRSRQLSELDAYRAMLLYFRRYSDMIRNPADVSDLLDDMSFGMVTSEGEAATLSPHRWSDWIKAIDDSRTEGDEGLS